MVSPPEQCTLTFKKEKTKAYVLCLAAVEYTDDGEAILEICRVNEEVKQ
jgi:hypothetical protein